MSIFDELKRRNVFKVAAAYIIVGWLIMQAGDTMAPALQLPEWVNSLLAFFLILGFPLAMFFAWAFEMTPDGIKKEKEVDRSQSITQVTSQKLNNLIIGLLLLALVFFAFDKFVLDPQRDAELVSATQEAAQEVTQQLAVTEGPADAKPDEKSIAVLPFVNMSDDASNEYFSDGITEELLNLLAKIPELRVTSRSSVFSLKGQNLDIPTVAKKLNVAHVLEGSVRKSGNRVRITAQLIRADSDVHMWSETFDRELDDVFAIQDEIAREVVSVLQVQLLGAVPETKATSTGAYTAYLQGKHLLETANRTDPLAALVYFRKAVEIDPFYAPAWAGVARALRWAANWGEISLAESTEEARVAANRALELDDTVADAWGMLGWIQSVYDWDWYAAKGTIKTALIHGPNNALVLDNASSLARAIGKFDDSIQLAQRAVEVDPLNQVTLRTLALAYWCAGQHVKSEQTMRRIKELYPERKETDIEVTSISLINQGRPEEALQYILREEVEHPENIEFVQLARAFTLYRLGKPEESERSLQVVIKDANDWLAYQIAEVYAWRNQPDQAFEWLEISFQQRDGGVTYLLGDPTMKSLHTDPRWEPFLLKLGLLDAWRNNAKPHWESRS